MKSEMTEFIWRFEATRELREGRTRQVDKNQKANIEQEIARLASKEDRTSIEWYVQTLTGSGFNPTYIAKRIPIGLRTNEIKRDLVCESSSTIEILFSNGSLECEELALYVFASIRFDLTRASNHPIEIARNLITMGIALLSKALLYNEDVFIRVLLMCTSNVWRRCDGVGKLIQLIWNLWCNASPKHRKSMSVARAVIRDVPYNMHCETIRGDLEFTVDSLGSRKVHDKAVIHLPSVLQCPVSIVQILAVDPSIFLSLSKELRTNTAVINAMCRDSDTLSPNVTSEELLAGLKCMNAEPSVRAILEELDGMPFARKLARVDAVYPNEEKENEDDAANKPTWLKGVVPSTWLYRSSSFLRDLLRRNSKYAEDLPNMAMREYLHENPQNPHVGFLEWATAMTEPSSHRTMSKVIEVLADEVAMHRVIANMSNDVTTMTSRHRIRRVALWNLLLHVHPTSWIILAWGVHVVPASKFFSLVPAQRLACLFSRPDELLLLVENTPELVLHHDRLLSDVTFATICLEWDYTNFQAFNVNFLKNKRYLNVALSHKGISMPAFKLALDFIAGGCNELPDATSFILSTIQDVRIPILNRMRIYEIVKTHDVWKAEENVNIALRSIACGGEHITIPMNMILRNLAQMSFNSQCSKQKQHIHPRLVENYLASLYYDLRIQYTPLNWPESKPRAVVGYEPVISNETIPIAKKMEDMNGGELHDTLKFLETLSSAVANITTRITTHFGTYPGDVYGEHWNGVQVFYVEYPENSTGNDVTGDVWKMFTAGGLEVVFPTDVAAQIPKRGMRGVLFGGNGAHQHVLKLIKKKVPFGSAGWESTKFIVHDADYDGNLIARMARLEMEASPSFMVTTKYTRLQMDFRGVAINEETVLSRQRSIVGKGGEGIFFAKSGTPWSRSSKNPKLFGPSDKCRSLVLQIVNFLSRCPLACLDMWKEGFGASMNFNNVVMSMKTHYERGKNGKKTEKVTEEATEEKNKNNNKNKKKKNVHLEVSAKKARVE